MMDKKFSRETKGKRTAMESIDYAEKRGAERIPLTLGAELIELEAGSRIAGRMTDCSATGCYIDSLNCFPGHTVLRLHLFRGKDVFEGDGRVVYSNPGLGMGIVFTEISPEQRERLLQWMAEGNSPVGLVRHTPSPQEEKKKTHDPADKFAALLELLVDKNVITPAEARLLQAEIII